MTGEAGTERHAGATTDRVAEEWSKGNTGARMYDFIVMHERLAGSLGRIMWGDNWRDLYSDIARLRDAPDGSRVIDIPCGGGVAFRGLTPDRPVGYVAADASPFMLDRARAEAARRGLTGIDFVQTGVDEMPFDDGVFDLCLSYNGLHCFPDPEHAASEMTRLLRPGGQLRGTALVTGTGRMSAACIAIFQHADQFGPMGTVEDIERWLAGAGIAEPRIVRRGAYAFFQGEKVS